MNSVVLFLSAIRENDRFLARVGGKVFDSRSRILLLSSFYLFRGFYESSYDDKSCWTIYVRENSSFQISIGIS